MAKRKKRRYKKNIKRKAIIYTCVGIAILVAIIVSIKMIA